MVRLYKKGSLLAIETDADNERAFLQQVSTLLAVLIESAVFPYDWAYLLDEWLQGVVSICGVMRFGSAANLFVGGDPEAMSEDPIAEYHEATDEAILRISASAKTAIRFDNTKKKKET